MTTKPTSKPRLWLRMVMGFAAAIGIAVAGKTVGAMLRGNETEPTNPVGVLTSVGLFGAVVVGMFGVLLVHELGHLLAGRWAGFRPMLLVIGPFRFERQRLRWRMRWNRDIALAGGLALALPKGESDPAKLRRSAAVTVAGGPVANLFLSAVLLLLWWGLFRGEPGKAGVLPVAFGLASLAIAVITLVPGRTSGYLTDGARLRLLWKGGPEADRDVAIQALFGASMSGVRPRDWPVELLEKARSFSDGSYLEVAAWQLAQLHAADAGRPAEARQRLDQILVQVDRLPSAARPGVRFDAARQLAMWGDLDRARGLMAEGGEALGAPFLKPIAELAILTAEGRHEEAREMLPAVRQAVAEASDPGSAALLVSDLDALADRITAA